MSSHKPVCNKNFILLLIMKLRCLYSLANETLEPSISYCVFLNSLKGKSMIRAHLTDLTSILISEPFDIVEVVIRALFYRLKIPFVLVHYLFS